MIGIYKITNRVNNKVYVGRSVHIERRWREHKNAAFNANDKCYNYPLYQAIRKYGIENFMFDILETCEVQEIQEKERFYVALYNAHKPEYGYNQTDGGDDGGAYRKFSEDDVVDITRRLSETRERIIDIAALYDVTEATIINFNKGATYHRDEILYPIRKYQADEPKQYYCRICGAPVCEEGNVCYACSRIATRKVERPAPLDLAKMIKEIGFTQTGKHFGVDGNAIKKWCDAYKIPRLLQDLIDWYNDQVGIVDPPKPVKQHKEKVDTRRPVKQIDLTTGEVIKIFESSNAAARACGANGGACIRSVCQGKGKIAYGYFWQYA